jgi:hypothetical protein
MPFDGTHDQILVDLYNARNNIAKGWCKGRLRDNQGNVCLVGAFGYSKYGRVQITPALNLLLSMIPGRFLPRQLRLELWNDKQRDVSSVLALLDRAIAKRERESL